MSAVHSPVLSSSESARAPLVGAPAGTRQCPAPECGRPLSPRQQACSGRCRALLSRVRRATRRQDRDRRLLRLAEQGARAFREILEALTTEDAMNATTTPASTTPR